MVNTIEIFLCILSLFFFFFLLPSTQVLDSALHSRIFLVKLSLKTC